MGFGDENTNDSGSGRTKDFLDIIPDPIGPNDPTERAENRKSQGRPKAIIAGVLIGVAIAGGVGWLVLDGLSGPSDSASVPTMTADKKPIKIRPDEPGGMNIPNQDKLVYDKLTNSIAKTESLTPPPRQGAPKEPLPVPITPKIPELPKMAPPPVANVVPPKVAQPKIVRLVPAAKTAVLPPVVAPKPVAKAVTTAPTQAKRAALDAKDAMSGSHLVQILAARDAARAESEWSRLAKMNDDLLGGMSHLVVRADLGSKGIYYRLRVGPFTDKASASAMCKSLAGRKVGCMIVRNK